MHTVQSILNEIKSGKISPIYFLMGEESFFIDQISTFIETSLFEEAQRGFDQTVIYGKDTSIDAIVSSAKRFPMGATTEGAHPVKPVQVRPHLGPNLGKMAPSAVVRANEDQISAVALGQLGGPG